MLEFTQMTSKTLNFPFHFVCALTKEMSQDFTIVDMLILLLFTEEEACITTLCMDGLDTG